MSARGIRASHKFEDQKNWSSGDAQGAGWPNPGNWLAFDVDGQICAVDSRQIRAVLRPQNIVPLPGRDVRCPGLLAWQDQVLVVLDLGACLGLRPSRGQAASRLLVCQGHGHAQAWGLLVDGVRGFQRIAMPEPGWIAVRPGLLPPWNAMFALLPIHGHPEAEVCAMMHLETLWEGCLSIMPGVSTNHQTKESP